jgi:hypothetical protein
MYHMEVLLDEWLRANNNKSKSLLSESCTRIHAGVGHAPGRGAKT